MIPLLPTPPPSGGRLGGGNNRCCACALAPLLPPATAWAEGAQLNGRPSPRWGEVKSVTLLQGRLHALAKVFGSQAQQPMG